ncbi:anthranilate synthase component II [Paraferrimonas haliotis]|uniref:Glutamine amidotransferase n=1 Tax=Paraferrimonas haliotis TaxID=2013866 RepID=A0AA37TSL5_9GAMM|nr:aminodeoxychorismate/anthranilate synthase component II [Paraferrimonas haliotis]GLS83367.1 glutamine amidotransferase [Paraferrimonas haliotis]
MLLMLDNYDSFTYNLVQYFQELGQQVAVVRNDQMSIADIQALNPSCIVVSPGPCSPDQAGVSLALVEAFASKVPILGVCLGHQTLAQVYGAKVVRAPQVMHGKTSLISHTGEGLFAGLNNPLQVTRYHSLIVDDIPDGFQLDAYLDDPQYGRLVMAMSQPQLQLYGVQFHPESIMTEQGHQLLQNFLNLSHLKGCAAGDFMV